MIGLEMKRTVKANGNEIGQSISLISGFAQQQEIFVPTLTVDEYLMIQAKLRMQESQAIRRERVDEIIEMLGLNKRRDSKIGNPGLVKGISGGEARRLTFACELLSNPSLMFADEPTSGLDSFMAASVVQIMRNLANSGRTLIAIIHQPTADLCPDFSASRTIRHVAFAVPASGLFALLSGLYGNTSNFPVYIRWMQWT
ncbi:hypothetical protein GCK72_008893 [Caenorhabditis remanei]|uniref:ABC transporter domain-containing protein n=1 Tax=Caenorhabditis remanei TaxID=31234 RepID=A0A6A5H1J6_CAERE|nr:hypothetical protein GCK72_008893 [Caenorhabditis remanei]KAF1760644.1 hypothetical protein GCK72_008893 [Caenorhabditis remanei]